MIVLKSIEELQKLLNSNKNQKKTVGFVPTMGALHQGHISLISIAKMQCDVVACSIFVNPTQFNDLSDLEKYPRTIETDTKMLEENSCDILFVPEISEMYSSEELALKKQNIEDRSWTEGKEIDFGQLDKVMEGAHRMGHFNGVAQVVSKLFRIVKPHKAFFGQKDFQQLAIIKSMVKQLEMPIEIVACPIIREADGLAMSSRNMRLTTEERKVSTYISKTLFKIKELQKIKTVDELKNIAKQEIRKQPIFELEYFEIVNAETLISVNDYKDAKSVVACVAVKLGDVRLIDNIVLF